MGIVSNKKRASSYHSEGQTLAQLPTPGADEIAHSKLLIDCLVAEIEQHAGVISFRDYMDRVLYAPGLGYYSAGLTKFGIDGDFITAPEISDLFGRTLARQCESIFEAGCERRILEFGAGSGRLCEQVLLALDEPCQYLILELSADLRRRQQDYLEEKLPRDLFERINWLETLPSGFDGIVLGNEVLDAMPVNLVRKDQAWFELGVGFDGSRFCWRRYADDGEAVSAIQLIESNHEILPEGYTSEINLNFQPWLAGLRDACNQAVVLMIDYGYLQAQYYHPQRSAGTLACHYHHRLHYDPLIYPGLQDVTASVDFDAFADAALLNNFNICGLATQGQFLLTNGLLEEAGCTEPGTNSMADLELAQQIKTLTLPGEMGDRFKVIGLQKNMNIEIDTFNTRR
jgi:SAM-dependent MidA family methyltransferase